MTTSLVPTLFSPSDAFKLAYPPRLQEFTAAAARAGLSPAAQDKETLAVVLVDYQHDFDAPEGALPVPGAQEDIARFLTWFYPNAGQITAIYASLDTHLPFQIFYSSWWHNPETGEPPAPMTIITEEDVMMEKWVPVFPEEHDWSLNYVRLLKQQAKKALMIWPYHTMEGTLGHMLSAPISEAIAWHSVARQIQPTYVVKGRTRRTEHYGIFGAEVSDPLDAKSDLNKPLLQSILRHSKVYVAGEAKSHCVLETVRQLVNFAANRADLLDRIYVLMDCTSSVIHEGIDFEGRAVADLSAMQQQGIHLVNSTDLMI